MAPGGVPFWLWICYVAGRLMDNFDGPVSLQPRVGDVIAGKYRLDRVVGAGGMGMVFAATHMELDRLVAVKFVHSTYCQNPEVIARFVREARAVVRIESEHVAKVIDVGHTAGDTPYMVMEYLDGEDLSSLLKFGPIAIPDAVDYVVQACAAMQEAHEMGIVHRDLKPANLFLTHRRDRTPLIKVLDFGISKLNDPEPNQAALTNPAMLMGSPAYMSPEQLTNPREVDPRTDLWSLGVILFELLAGRPAFQAQSLPLLMTAIMQQQPDSLIQLRPDVPPGLASVVARCLEKSVSARFQAVSELVAALLPFAPRRSHWNIERIAKSVGGASVRGAMLEHGQTLGSSSHSASGRPVAARGGTRGEWSRESDPAPRRKARWGVPVVIAGGVLAAAATAWFVSGWGTDADDTANSVATSAVDAVVASSAVVLPSTVNLAPTVVVPAAPRATNQVPVTTSANASATDAPPEAARDSTPTTHPVNVGRPKSPAAPRVAPASEPKPPAVEPQRPSPGPLHRNPLQMDIK